MTGRGQKGFLLSVGMTGRGQERFLPVVGMTGVRAGEIPPFSRNDRATGGFKEVV